jgi:PIN domain nuclease of toxin-antitoxin system
MRYLVDTVIWLWSLDSLERLNRRGYEILNSASEEIYFSAATAWEISIKASLGKVKLPSPPRTCVPAFMEKQGLKPLPVNQLHAVQVYDLPKHHRDPFDRLIIAQAIVENMAVLTADHDFERYPVEVVWCGK